MAKEKISAHSPLELKKMIREGRFARLYIFFGEETFLLNYYLGQLKRHLVDELTESFNFHKLTQENFDIREFSDAVESLPMMAEHTFVWVDDIDIFKLNEDEREKIQQILADIPDYCTVLFSHETQEWKPDARYRKLYQTVTENACVVEFPKQELRDLIAWVTRHFSANGKKISPDLCSYLIELSGGTMITLSGEISKICAYSGADTIVKEDIDSVVEPIMDALVFQMTDMLAEGKYADALCKLQTLLKMQEKPLAILGAIGNHLRQMSAVRILLDSGESYNKLSSLFPRLPDFVARKLANSCKRFSPRFYKISAELVMEADRKIKTSYDDPGRILEMLLLELAQEARNG